MNTIALYDHIEFSLKIYSHTKAQTCCVTLEDERHWFLLKFKHAV